MEYQDARKKRNYVVCIDASSRVITLTIVQKYRTEQWYAAIAESVDMMRGHVTQNKETKNRRQGSQSQAKLQVYIMKKGKRDPSEQKKDEDLQVMTK